MILEISIYLCVDCANIIQQLEYISNSYVRRWRDITVDLCYAISQACGHASCETLHDFFNVVQSYYSLQFVQVNKTNKLFHVTNMLEHGVNGEHGQHVVQRVVVEKHLEHVFTLAPDKLMNKQRDVIHILAITCNGRHGAYVQQHVMVAQNTGKFK